MVALTGTHASAQLQTTKSPELLKLEWFCITRIIIGIIAGVSGLPQPTADSTTIRA
jgi:hypothetical protein